MSIYGHWLKTHWTRSPPIQLAEKAHGDIHGTPRRDGVTTKEEARTSWQRRFLQAPSLRRRRRSIAQIGVDARSTQQPGPHGIYSCIVEATSLITNGATSSFIMQ